MEINFYKYQGTGNDFIIIDNRNKKISLRESQIKLLCDRKFGIGADGLMFIENQKGFDFKMVYFNSDGRKSTMCGNGGRCFVRFASDLKIINKLHAIFIAVDGLNEALINDKTIKLVMQNCAFPSMHGSSFVLNTGSPHLVKFVKDVSSIDVQKEGAKIRYSKNFIDEGINVNFVTIKNSVLEVRTYERGVETETLSCGTGVTACALAYAFKTNEKQSSCQISTRGGKLKISFSKKAKSFENVILEGPAEFVFKGVVIV